MIEFIGIIISIVALVVFFIMASDINTIKKANIAQTNTLKQIYNLLYSDRDKVNTEKRKTKDEFSNYKTKI